MRDVSEGTASPGRIAALQERKRHVLILNWRDMSNPQAGGAEKVTQEIARRWVAWGHQVTLFCASYPGARPEEIVDGVRMIRRGHQHTVHWEAYRYYKTHALGDCDVIVDEINTVPFFAPLYAREPVLMFCHQLAREIWRYEARFPLSTIGYLLEPAYLQAYRRTPIMTVSLSTQDDLRRLGLAGPYHVIPEAVDTTPPETLPLIDVKESGPTLAFVGRVVPSKRVDHIVRALKLLRQEVGMDACLWIIGSWDEAYYRSLNDLVEALGLMDHVVFWGRLDEVAKERLLMRAHVFVMTSVREGWGLVVTEANMMGTPAVVYNVPGLRDSTRDGETGIVCKSNTPDSLARGIATLLAEPTLYARLRENAWATAKELNWDRTALAAWDAITACIQAKGASQRKV